MARMKLSPPWCQRYSQIAALFKYDSEVHVIFDEDNYEVKLYVDDDNKAAALTVLLPEEYEFGNIRLKVQVVPANGDNADANIDEDTPLDELFELAFSGNGAFSFAKTIHGVMLLDGITYVVFNKQVVQYYTDNLSDYFGNCSTLYQDIAKDVFGERQNLYYSTDIEDPVLGSPLGEWP